MSKLQDQLDRLSTLESVIKLQEQALKQNKADRDKYRSELEAYMYELDTKSLKTPTHTVTLAQKATLHVIDEKKAFQWMEQVGLDTEPYTTLNKKQFLVMANAMRKDTGNAPEGTELLESEVLTIRSKDGK